MKLKSLMNDFIQNYLDENAIKFEDWNISTNNQDGFGDYYITNYKKNDTTLRVGISITF